MKTFQWFLFSPKKRTQFPEDRLSVCLCLCVPWAIQRREKPKGLAVKWSGTWEWTEILIFRFNFFKKMSLMNKALHLINIQQKEHNNLLLCCCIAQHAVCGYILWCLDRIGLHDRFCKKILIYIHYYRHITPILWMCTDDTDTVQCHSVEKWPYKRKESEFANLLIFQWLVKYLKSKVKKSSNTMNMTTWWCALGVKRETNVLCNNIPDFSIIFVALDYSMKSPWPPMLFTVQHFGYQTLRSLHLNAESSDWINAFINRFLLRDSFVTNIQLSLWWKALRDCWTSFSAREETYLKRSISWFCESISDHLIEDWF